MTSLWLDRRLWLAMNLLIPGLTFPMQLKPPVQPPLVGPVGPLLVQPGFHTDASYPPQVLQDRKVVRQMGS
jgi:hypothetical protein